ncbi:S1C family serine protease [Oceanobacillus saliphilus]|uniref:S1C family serine protease n=1 Tax=Oceanobacillus saliphilus TaxID=2925834 RepID=UPI00201DFE88|nr:trypsin-like peptidase domain-containing protein [Oceanobacillus saliphilus]
MRIRRYPPIIISILILIIGFIVVLNIYDNWKSEEITINNPIVHEVTMENTSLDLKSIIHDAEKSVIQIEGQNDFSNITGSGFLYNDKGDIITNAHVIQNADAINVRTSNAEIYPAAVIGISEEVDIAVIRVPQLAGLSSLPIAEESIAEIGDEVIALGSPHGFQNTVTLGIISGTDRNFSIDGFNYSNVYQISAQISQGNSGGPLIKRDTGEIIGINSVGTQDGTIGFSIPIVEVFDQITRWSNEAQNEQLDFPSVTDLISFSDPDQAIEAAEYLTSYFLESISVRDYVGAYTLLGSSLQLELTYKEFRNKYINIINLEFAELDSSVIENNRLKTTTEVTVERNVPNELETMKETLSFQFTIGYENDQLKILDYSVADS